MLTIAPERDGKKAPIQFRATVRRIIIDWGDGSGLESYTGRATLTHQYAGRATYTVEMKARRLKAFDCSSAHMTALDISDSPRLKRLDCAKNKLTATALDAVFAALPRRRGVIAMANNPGADGCNRTVAKNKGWKVKG
jgi:hypothetical protein